MTGPARKLLAAAVAALAVLFLVVYLLAHFPEAMEDSTSKPILAHQILLLIFVGASLILHWRARPGQAIGQATLWLAIAGLLFAGYGFRDEAATFWNRLAGELLPHRGIEGEEGSITFPARRGGHFVVEADVDGVAVRLLVDTGASHVILSPGDARRIGFKLASLDYTRAYRTAGGLVFGAPVVLSIVIIGPIRIEGVQASVSGGTMGQSLLGMSFLNRLSGYRVAGGRLTLQAPH